MAFDPQNRRQMFVRPKQTLKLKIRTKARVVAINFDDKTDSEAEYSDNGTDSDIYSLGISSELSQCSDINKSDSDLETNLDLIEEVFKDSTQLDQIIDNHSVDENGVQIIRDNLKNGSNGCKSSTSGSKRKKSKYEESKSKRKLINQLNEENLDLYRKITDLTQQLAQKEREIQQMVRNRPKILCLICDKTAVQQFFCCFKGCYCSDKCKTFDWLTNRHFSQCLNPSLGLLFSVKN